MLITPRPGYIVALESSVTETSKSGLFIPSKASGFKILASAVDGLVVGEIVLIIMKEVVKFEMTAGTVYIIPAASVIATVKGA